MSSSTTRRTDEVIVCHDISKFYGDVLGINNVDLTIPKGITSLVGPNGSGKSTLMNLLTGLLQPSRGSITVLGESPRHPERFFQNVGYCTQFDSFPRGLTGRQFIAGYLRVHGLSGRDARSLTVAALEQVRLVEAADRKIAGYSKGMRQRIKLAQAIAHRPQVLILDEPLNGLDPLARADIIALFRSWADKGMHVIISSHILHEVDLLSDQVIMLNEGYVVAEGEIPQVRREMKKHPLKVTIRCNKPAELAEHLIRQDHVVEVRMHADRAGILISTEDADGFYLFLNQVVVDCGIEVEHVAPADEDVSAVYEYLIGKDG